MNQRLKKEYRYTRFYWLLAFLLLLVFLRYGFQIGIPRIALVAVIALIALLGNHNEILAITLCCIPLHAAIDFFYTLVICAAVFIMKNYRRIRINLAVILALAMVAWELLHCFAADFSLVTFLTTIIPLIFLAVILCADISDVDYDFIVRAMAVVAAVICLTLLTNQIVRAGFDLSAAIKGFQRLGMITAESENTTIEGGAINPNTLGIICILSITALLQLRTAARSRIMDVPLMIVLLVFGALTSSRTFLVCLVLMAVLMVMAQPGDLTKKIRFLGSLLLLAAVALLLLNWLFPDLLEYYVQRFFVDDITTGRDKLLITYNKYISENLNVLFFGIGLHSYGTTLVDADRVAVNVPHNSIQEIIIAWGIPGLVLFVLLLVMMIRQSRRYSKRQNLLNYIPLMILLVKSLAGQLLTSGYSMLALSYAYLSLSQNFNKDMLHDP